LFTSGCASRIGWRLGFESIDEDLESESGGVLTMRHRLCGSRWNAGMSGTRVDVKEMVVVTSQGGEPFLTSVFGRFESDN
jgi:hypothetical protein